VAEIVRFFHGSQIVHDVLEVGRFYHDFFGSWVYEAQQLAAEDARNSSNLLGGNFSIEMLAPTDADANTGTARFLRRHGPHFNNIAFWARDCRGIAQQLLDRGVRVAVRGAGFASELPPGPFDYVITHPKDTHGVVLEFLEDQQIHDPRDRAWWDSSYWRDRHPLGIERFSHSTFVVADVDAAGLVFAEALECERVPTETDPHAVTRSVYFAVADSFVELASPTVADSDAARHLERHGPMLYAFTFVVRDVERVRAHADRFGIAVHSPAAHTVELDPAATFNAIYRFTDKDPL
jgi:4-hydroxyphenylpyruvate dioxygenase-like putative hemolysin